MIIGFVGLAVAGWGFYIQPVSIMPGSCYESDSGIDWATQGTASAWLTGIVNSTTSNGTQFVSFTDSCQGNTLLEGVCGAQYGYSNLAGILNLSCSELGNYICLNGACVSNATLFPDLTVNLYVNNIISNIVNGSAQFLVNYSIVYRNIGNVGSPSVSAFFSQQGPAGGSGGTLTVPPLNPGQIFTLNNPQMISGPNIYGLWTAMVAIDPGNVLPELNENNNNATVIFNINQTGSGNNTLLADLIVFSLNYSFAPFAVNGTNSTMTNYTGTLMTTVKNVGIGSAPASLTKVRFGFADYFMGTPSLAPGQSVSIYTGMGTSTVSGSYIYSANVDWYNSIPEFNENNNALNTTVVIP